MTNNELDQCIPTASADGTHICRGGGPWFLLADTIWSAFTHVPLNEWKTYLEIRRAQGFNALQISVLPILHDMSGRPSLPDPFPGFWDERPRFGALSKAYVEAAAERLEAASVRGLTPVLVDVWANYAPDTWASKKQPQYVIPKPALEEYLASVAAAFGQFHPIHFVSGDADFESAESISYYEQALRLVKQQSPNALTALHLQPWAKLPDSLADADEIYLYVYQSGHHVEQQDRAFTLAEEYRKRPRRKPVINAEPCYEGAGFGYRYGRFSTADVRRASWQSVLAGASAGLAYGAHGIWQWHRRGATFNHADFSGEPFDRWIALMFSGARDAAYVREVIDERNLHDLVPAQELLSRAQPGVRAARNREATLCAIYVPFATEIDARINSVVSIERINLETREVDISAWTENDGAITVPMQDWPGDSLILVQRGAE